jgi:hypothetical protein
MAISPGPLPEPPPSGSSATDVSYSIDSTNLALLSNSTKSTLLSVSNIGSAITSRINSTLDLIDAFGSFESYLLNGTVLDSLASGSTSAALSITDVGTSRFIRLVIILGDITPTGTPKVVVTSGSTAYELSVSLTSGKKRLEFNNLPAAFVSSFTIKNSTGTAFASYGNSVVVVGL